MRVRAKYVIETEFEVYFLDEEEKPINLEYPLTDALFEGGLSQYMKDYDPDMRNEAPIHATYVLGDNNFVIEEELTPSTINP